MNVLADRALNVFQVFGFCLPREHAMIGGKAGSHGLCLANQGQTCQLKSEKTSANTILKLHLTFGQIDGACLSLLDCDDNTSHSGVF